MAVYTVQPPLWEPGSKPHTYTSRVNTGHPLADGLVFYTLADTPGNFVDLARGILVPWKSGTTIGGHIRGQVGTVTDATTEGATMTCPAHLKLEKQITVVWRGVVYGAGTGGCSMICVDEDGTDTVPYVSYGLFRSSGDTTLNGFWNNVGVFSADPTAVGAIVYGEMVTFAFVLRTTTPFEAALYKDGKLLTNTGTGGQPQYTSTSKFNIGCYADTSRNANCITDCAAIYNRILSTGEIKEFADNPWAMLEPHLSRRQIFNITEGGGGATYPGYYTDMGWW